MIVLTITVKFDNLAFNLDYKLFIEFIIYLCTSDEDFAKKYG